MQAGPIPGWTSELTVWSGMLRSVGGTVQVVGADQVLIVAVDGLDERRLIVEGNGGHDVVVDVEAFGEQRFVIVDEHHPAEHSLDAGYDELVHTLEDGNVGGRRDDAVKRQYRVEELRSAGTGPHRDHRRPHRSDVVASRTFESRLGHAEL